MPTGYTWGVANGTVTSFSQFAMGCARAFGALVHMRDDSSDAEIRPREVSPWHAEQIAESRAQLARLDAMAADEAEATANYDWVAATKAWEGRNAERREQSNRYLAMFDSVEKWVPPSGEHQRFKAFMMEQLRDSMAHDCNSSYDMTPVRVIGSDYLQQQREATTRSIEYHEKRMAEESESVKLANAWVDALRQSLKP